MASLAWATWIAATSTVVGAVCAQRLRDRGGDGRGAGRDRCGGSALARRRGRSARWSPCCWSPYRPAAARVPDTFSPQTVAAGYAAVGLLVGVLVAIWALHSRAAATNVIATTGWLWLLAVVSVVDGVLAGRGLTSAQLGIWQISADSDRFWIRDYFYWPGALLALGSALVIGALAARRAARAAGAPGRGGGLRRGRTAARRGGLPAGRAAGWPRSAAEQVSAHLIAPYAVIAGVGGSVLVAALASEPSGPRRRATAPADGVTPAAARTGEPDDLGRPDGTAAAADDRPGRPRTRSARRAATAGADGRHRGAGRRRTPAPRGTRAGRAGRASRRDRTVAARAAGPAAVRPAAAADPPRRTSRRTEPTPARRPGPHQPDERHRRPPAHHRPDQRPDPGR